MRKVSLPAGSAPLQCKGGGEELKKGRDASPKTEGDGDDHVSSILRFLEVTVARCVGSSNGGRVPGQSDEPNAKLCPR